MFISAGKKFQVGHLLSTTLYLIPTQLGLNRKTFRRVRSSITTFLTHSTQFSANVIDGKNQKILGKIKKFFVIQLQCILYIAAPLNLLLGEMFSDLFYSLRYNNKEFFNFAQNFLIFASGYLKLQIGLFERKYKFQVGHLLSTTLYLMPAKLGFNRTTLRGVRSSITTHFF